MELNKVLEELKNVTVIVSEVDGIITEHLTPIDELGNTPFKLFYMKDFEAVNEIKKTFKFVFISSDNSVSYNLFRSKNIPFYWAPKDKKSAILSIRKKYNAKADNLLYIGNSYSDLGCIHLTPLSGCPEDAVVDIKINASFVLPVLGGAGVLCELYQLLKPEILRRRIEA